MLRIRLMLERFLAGKQSPTLLENTVVMALLLTLSLTIAACVGGVFGMTLDLARAAIGRI